MCLVSKHCVLHPKAFDEAVDKFFPQPPVKKPKTLKVNTAIKTDQEKLLITMKACHRSWDEHKKSIVASLLKAKESEYVAPKLIQDLEALLQGGSKADASIEKQEVVAKNGGLFNEGDQTTIKQEIDKVKSHIESSKKLIKKIDQLSS